MNTVCENTEGWHLLQPGEDLEYLEVATSPRLRSLEELMGKIQVDGEGKAW